MGLSFSVPPGAGPTPSVCLDNPLFWGGPVSRKASGIAFPMILDLLWNLDPRADQQGCSGHLPYIAGCRTGQRVPPSLQNIYKELRDDLGCSIPRHGCLTKVPCSLQPQISPSTPSCTVTVRSDGGWPINSWASRIAPETAPFSLIWDVLPGYSMLCAGSTGLSRAGSRCAHLCAQRHARVYRTVTGPATVLRQGIDELVTAAVGRAGGVAAQHGDDCAGT